MKVSKEIVRLVAKVLVALLAIGALLAVAGRSIAPHLSGASWLLACAVWGGAIVALVILLVAIKLQISQFILRSGGTDAQWFWFKSEPPGLTAQRVQHEAAQRQRKV